jgi:hypothetical protein
MSAVRVEHGDPRVPARVWAKIAVAESGCWLWTGATAGSGRGPARASARYGVAQLDGKLRLVHRWVYHATVAPVDQDTAPGRSADHVHHECGVTLCVNPAHLQAMPAGEHLGHGHRDKTECRNGHAYDERNTRVRPNGWRTCRACERARRRRARGLPAHAVV